jgi:hypothetical protein
MDFSRHWTLLGSFGGRLLMRLWLIPALVAFAACATSLPAVAESKIDYTRDVRPILADNCLRCHGNDPTHREAELRLDEFAAGKDFRGAEDVIIPGDPDASEFLNRITTDDADMHMPPASTGKALKPEQIETLRRWIAEGAEYQKHWSFVAPKRPEVPQAVAGGAVHNPIDAFVLRRLDKVGLKPSPPVDRARLLRRLSLDLVGLPPTPEEVAEFVADDRDDATSRAIERLLASPHFGERWARPWLDAARYADSDGFEKDKPRTVWMYRDWVVNAFNEDMPYDQFLIEQIAGDLLPHPTQDQLVATGFLRNSMINEEGGVDPEQFRMEAMFDRMDAIGKAMLGLTVQCAQCHTHKFDPITHADYYRMFAFVNNCDEGQVTTYADQEFAEWQATERVIQTIEDQIKAENPDWQQRMAAWEASVRDDQPPWTVVRPDVDMTGDQKHYVLEDGSVLAQGYAPTIHDTDFDVEVDARKITAFRLELLNDQNLPSGGPGRSIYGTFALTEFTATAGAADGSGERTELKFKEATADVNPPERDLEKAFDDRSERKRVTGPIAYANDGDDLSAWTIEIGPGRSNVPRKAVFVLEKPLESAGKLRINFKLYQSHGGWNSDDNQNNNLGRFRFSITDADGAKADPVPADVRTIFAVPADERTADQVDRVFSFWRTTVADFAEQNRRIDALWLSHPRGATQLVLLERPDRRPTHRLDRGNFLAPAEEVTPGVPSFLHSLNSEEGVPARLAFARWLADRRSPTAARTIVNRLWLAYFGMGLTSTAEDLGTQGELPSHRELLDWLAVELMDHGWSLKHIHRLIVSSATYQQSSVVSPELLATDPDNRLLARGPRFRVDAEVVRDIALAASGLLTQTLGGPGVYPPAPEFLFQPPTSYGPKPWHFDLGRDKYRRSLYTVRYRSIPYPALQVFDAPTGDFACVRRVRSNTPLQALTTLNEPLMIECARALAIEAVSDAGPSDRSRLDYAFNRCLSRSPRDSEWTLLEDFLAKQRARFNAEGADAWSVLADDKAPKPELPAGVSAPDMAAWTATARVILNLDETITKE